VDAEEAVAHVLRTRQQPLQLHLLAAPVQRLDIHLQLRQLVRIAFAGRQLEELRQVLDLALHLLHRLDHRLERTQLAHDALGPVLVIPEPRLRHLEA
jgi:hypothetical protein